MHQIGWRVAWGNCTLGSASLTDRDYFRSGVVPEPSAGVLLGAMLLVGRLRRIEA